MSVVRGTVRIPDERRRSYLGEDPDTHPSGERDTVEALRDT